MELSTALAAIGILTGILAWCLSKPVDPDPGQDPEVVQRRRRAELTAATVRGLERARIVRVK